MWYTSLMMPFMKKAIAIFGIIAFTSLAVFGFLAVNDNASTMIGCIAAALGANTACPLASPMEEAVHHVGALKSLSTLLVTAVFALAQLAFVAIAPSLAISQKTAAAFGSLVPCRNEVALRRWRRWSARRILSPCA